MMKMSGRVLFASLKLRKLSEALAHLPVPAGGAIIVLDRDGSVLARSSQADQWLGKKRYNCTFGTWWGR